MKITNETIKKLTARELNDLNCFDNLHIILVKGVPKMRTKTGTGWWVGKFNEAKDEILYRHQDGGDIEFELIKHAGEGWAFRARVAGKDQYWDVLSPLAAMPFVKIEEVA